MALFRDFLFSGAERSQLLVALDQLERRMAAWVADGDAFAQLLSQVYGPLPETAEQALQETLLTGSLNLPLQILDGDALQGALGAYTSQAPGGGARVYLNGTWLAHASAEAIEAVLLHELGHAFDAVLKGGVDTPGEEGEAFAALILGRQPFCTDGTLSEQRQLLVQGTAVMVETLVDTTPPRGSLRSTAPAYASPSTTAFGISGIGDYASPVFADVDRDGDLDLLIGSNAGPIWFFRNTAAAGASAHAYASASSNPFGISRVNGAYRASPAFADIDSDGDLDLFIGISGGNTLFYRNIATAGASVPAYASPSTNSFGITNVGGYASPALADIDGDGDLDLFIGNSAGNTLFFRNTGGPGAPAYASPSTNPFGVTNVVGQAAPAFGDADGDGDLDLFVGRSDGNTSFFRNIGVASAPVYAGAGTNPFGITDVGAGAAPAFADVDGDADLDLYIGESGGNILFFRNTAATPVAPVTSSTADGVYGVGAVITLQVSFNEPVIVDSSGGTPRLLLETGSTDRYAVYSSGSGTTSLTFLYTVQAGDSSSDLDQASASALELNGATIRDAAGNNAILTLAAPGASGSLATTAAVAINKAPVASGTASLTAITEDLSSPTGDSVLNLFSANFTDSEHSSLLGAVITANAASDAEGAWQWWDGSSWTAIATSGLADESGLFLDAVTLIRFLPAANFSGIPGSLAARLVDGSITAPTNGSTVDVSTNGGATAYSAAIVSLGTVVTPVNDAPAGADQTIHINQDSVYIFRSSDFGFSDPDDKPANQLAAVKISTVPGSGSLTFQGTAVNAGDVISAADITAGKLSFAPAANPNSTAAVSFTFQVQDNGGIANGGVDLDPTANTLTLPTLPQLRVERTAFGDEESGAATEFTFRRGDATTTPLSEPLSIQYRLLGTATPGVDFTGANSGTLTFAAGSAVATLSLPTLADGVVDPGETIIAKILSQPGYAIAPASQFATGTITAESVQTRPRYSGGYFGNRSGAESLNGFAFASLRSDGSVVSWGDATYGADSSAVDFDGAADNLFVSEIFSNIGSFAALRSDGSVVTWGDSAFCGGDSSGVDFNGPSNNLTVSTIFSNYYAFAALRSDGSVVTWGGVPSFGGIFGGDSSGVDFNGPSDDLSIVQIVADAYAFAALRSDGSAVTWGYFPADSGVLDLSGVVFGGPSQDVTLTQLFSTTSAFAALGSDGSVITWGDSDRGGDSSGVDFNGPSNNLSVTQIYSSSEAFAALRSDGSVVTWGDAKNGGNSSGVDFNGPSNNLSVTQIYSTGEAFAALRTDGSVVTWGNAASGGDSSGVDFDGPSNNLSVSQIFATASAFAALRSDGSIVTWGNAASGGDSSGVDFDGPSDSLSVTQIFSTGEAFAALRTDGSVVTWGNAASGGDSSGVDFDGPSNNLSVSQIFATASAFAALRSDGSIVTWGNAASGGDSSGVDFDGPDNTLKAVAFANADTDDVLVLPPTATLAAIQEDNISAAGATVEALFADSFVVVTNGISPNPLAGIAISSYTPDARKGDWQYSTNGSSWSTLNPIAAATAAFTLKTSDSLRFVPAANWNGLATPLAAKLIASSTSVTTATTVDATGGDATPYSLVAVKLVHSVNAVNDAPVASGSATLAAIAEDNSTPTGASVASLFSGNFSDATDAVSAGSSANNLAGVVITANLASSAEGEWQWADGNTWWSIAGTGLADATGLFLDAATLIRFVPALNFNGTPGSLTARLVDDSSPSPANGSTVDAASTGGVSPYSDGMITLATSITPVNDVPSGTDGSVTTLEDTSHVFAVADFGFSDPDDSPANNLTAVRVSSLPGAGSLQLDGSAVTANDVISAADIAAGKLTFTPGANGSGNGYASFTFQVQDDGGSANGGVDLDPTANTITIDVTPVNDAPSGTDGSVTILEDTTHVFAVADFGFGDPADSPANNLTAVKVSSLPGAGSLQLDGSAVTANDVISAADIAAGKLTFTPGANGNGTGYASFGFQVQDDGGTANGGVDLDPIANTITIDVTPVNDAPVGTDGTVTTLQDTAYMFAVADFGYSDPADSPANNLTAVMVSSLPGAGSLQLDGSAVTANDVISAADIAAGKLTFTPGSSATGNGYASFTFQVQDDGGTANGGVDLDPTANTITIDVTALNDAPSGTDGSVTTLEDTAHVFAVADFGFSDPDDNPANSLAAVEISTLPAAGTLKLDGTAISAGDAISAADITAGKLSYSPADDANGTGYASFTFQVQDDGGTANGGVDLDPTANTITIDVTPVNDAPSGTDGTVTILEDTTHVFAVADFGFSDPADSPANNLTAVRVSSLPGAGSLQLDGSVVTANDVISAADIAAGKLTFTPGANGSGNGYASFGFQVQDDGGTANGGVDLDPIANTITIDVTPVNDAPAGRDRMVNIGGAGQYVFKAADFAIIDALDSPADPLAGIVVTTLPGLGLLKLNGSAVTAGTSISVSDITAGAFTFAPANNPGSSSDTSFTFQVRDGGGTRNNGVDLDPIARTFAIDTNALPTGSVLMTPSTFLKTGDTVTADSSSLADDDGIPVGAPLIQWQYSSDGTTWVEIAGAVGPSLLLTEALADKQVRAQALYTDLGGTYETVSSAASEGVRLLWFGTKNADCKSGTRYNDSMDGGEGTDALYGLVGDDWLNGGKGVDNMAGGPGNDSYFVDSKDDRIMESPGEGCDEVFSKTSFSLKDRAPNVERLTLTGTKNDDHATGNEMDNILTGTNGRNVLDGGLGNDMMAGGFGNDIYVIDSPGDVVVEEFAGGIDEIRTAVTAVLPLYVENLTLSSPGAMDGTGNAAPNKMVGNASANVLRGLAGNDDLSGGDGADLLDGGTGVDKLTGGRHADMFRFSSPLLLVGGCAETDLVTDFRGGEGDRFQLSTSVFPALTGAAVSGVLKASAFLASTSGLATNTDQRILYNTSNGVLSYDSDGLGGASAYAFAKLEGKAVLLSSSFQVFADS